MLDSLLAGEHDGGDVPSDAEGTREGLPWADPAHSAGERAAGTAKR